MRNFPQSVLFGVATACLVLYLIRMNRASASGAVVSFILKVALIIRHYGEEQIRRRSVASRLRRTDAPTPDRSFDLSLCVCIPNQGQAVTVTVITSEAQRK